MSTSNAGHLAPATRPAGLPRRARLLAAAALVPHGSRVADIGSGHGLLPRLLLASGRASFCIASELSPETLAWVRPLPARLPLAGQLELRVGDGLSVLEPDDRIDVAMLLGLGARTIARILDDLPAARLGIRRFVIQPQTEFAELRAGLYRRGLVIRDERLVADRGRVYLLLAAEPGGETGPPRHPQLSPAELLEVGPILVRSADPLVLETWQTEYRRRRGIADRAVEEQERHQNQAACQRARRIVSVLKSHSARSRGPNTDDV